MDKWDSFLFGYCCNGLPHIMKAVLQVYTYKPASDILLRIYILIVI